MFTQKIIASLFILLFCVFNSSANERTDTIDLAALSPASTSVYTISFTGDLKFVLKNKIPNAQYNVSISFSYHPIESFVWPGENLLRSAQCEPEEDAAFMAFKNKVRTEKDVERTIASTLEKFKKDHPLCVSQLQSLNQRLKQSTIQNIPLTYSIKKGKNIHINIVRILPGDGEYKPDTAVFNIEYRTESRGDWQIVYGFTFAPNWFNNNETFFSDAVKDSVNQYKITKKRDQDFWDLTFVPSIFFNWSPTKFKASSFSPSFTGGLGSDLERIQVMLGGNLTYNGNLGVAAGVLFSNHPRLRGEYYENDVITENLSFDQLHEQVVMPEFFFSVTFRFNDNPFKKAE